MHGFGSVGVGREKKCIFHREAADALKLRVTNRGWLGWKLLFGHSDGNGSSGAETDAHRGERRGRSGTTR